MGGYGATRGTAATMQQSSASAQPLFVGPAIEPPLPQQSLFNPFMTPVVPASQGAPRARAWSPPVVMGHDECTGVLCPAGKQCRNGVCVPSDLVIGSHNLGPPIEVPQVDQSMKNPPTPTFVMKRPNVSPGAPTEFKPGVGPGQQTAPPTFTVQPEPTIYRGGGSTPGGTQHDDQRQVAILEPTEGGALPPSGGGGLAIAAIAAYFLFF